MATDHPFSKTWSRRSRPLPDRFWEKVDKNGPTVRPELGPCWEWTAHKDANGYGCISREDGNGFERAHRVSWELHFGAIPKGRFICHHCDRPSCSNPAHLFLGDHGENARDCARKGRNFYQQHPEAALRGEDKPQARLTNIQVMEIRIALRRNESQRALARQYGVTPGTIAHIFHGRSWRHVQ